MRAVRRTTRGRLGREQKRDGAENHHRIARRNRKEEEHQNRPVRVDQPVGEQQTVKCAGRADSR